MIPEPLSLFLYPLPTLQVYQTIAPGQLSNVVELYGRYNPKPIPRFTLQVYQTIAPGQLSNVVELYVRYNPNPIP